MNKGFSYLEEALEDSSQKSTYHLEAGIASIHASASSFEETDWMSIYFLYEKLYQLNPSPIVALNKAIAAAYAVNKKTALEQMMSIKTLDHYYLFHTSVGEMHYDLNNKEEARKHFQIALSLTQSKPVRELLQSKLDKCI